MPPKCLDAFLAATLLVSGCASYRGHLVLDPIGPPLPRCAGIGAQGTLMVFTAYEVTADFNGNPYRRRYSDYRILTADGQRVVEGVHNDKGFLAEGPRKVDLSVGTYRVEARANGYGQVTVPVEVCVGQTTTVHLEGSPWWPNPAVIAHSNPVRLPGGEIAGWRASGQAEPIPRN